MLGYVDSLPRLEEDNCPAAFCVHFLDDPSRLPIFQRSLLQAISPVIAGFEALSVQFAAALAGFVAAVVATVSVLPAPVLESWGHLPAQQYQVAGLAGAVAAPALAEAEVSVEVRWLLLPRQRRDRPGSTPWGCEVVRHWRHC